MKPSANGKDRWLRRRAGGARPDKGSEQIEEIFHLD
jgi:hypothetical protein